MGSPAGFTRRAFALRAGTTLLILLAIWPSLALAQSGTTGAGGPTAEGLLDTTARLCTQGRFEQASAAARQLLLLRQGNRDAKPHEITDAQWLVKTCDLAAGLSGENQAQLASAYAMDAQLDDQYERGRFSEGATQAARQLEIRERLLGREHPETARSLSRRGAFLLELGDYAPAESLLLQALRLQREAFGNEHPDVAVSLNRLGLARKAMGDYTGAESLLREALAIRRLLWGEEHPTVAITLRNLGVVLWNQGRYAEAEELLRNALSMSQTLLGEEHSDVVAAARDLGSLCWDRGKYAEAEALLRKTLVLNRLLHGEEHVDVAMNLHNLGLVLGDQGDNLGAEHLLRTSVVLLRKTVGSQHPYIAVALNNLGVTLWAEGKLPEAESVLREAVALNRETLGPDHPDIALSLSNLGRLLWEEEEPRAAEPLLREALEMSRRLLGEDHPDVSYSMYNLGLLLEGEGQIPEAEAMFREALRLRQKTLNGEHPEVATSLSSLGGLLRSQGHFAEAESCLQAGLTMRRHLLGDAHPYVAETLEEIGLLHMARGDYRSAEQALLQAAQIFETSRSRLEPGIGRATFLESPYEALAAARLEEGKPADAWQAFERGRGRVLAEFLRASGGCPLAPSEVAKEDSVRRQLDDLEERLETLTDAVSGSDAEGIDTELAGTRDLLKDAEAAWSQFQCEMAERYPVSMGRSFDLGRVQASLPERTAIVGWLDFSTEGVAPHSWGYVVRHTGLVTWVRLRTESDRARDADALTEARDFRRTLMRTESVGLRARLTSSVVDQAHLLWKERVAPLAEALDGVEELIVIPAGPMLGIPVESLVNDRGEFLGDVYAVSYAPSSTVYTSLREASATTEPAPLIRALLVGDPTFHADDTAWVSQQEPSTLRRVLSGDQGALSDLWPLPWTRREVEATAPLFAEPTVLLGRDASEQALVELAQSGKLGQFDLLHLATHALIDDRRPERSTLVLSLVDLPDPLEAAVEGRRIFDGFLTAADIARDWKLDARLVTLSACETGLGKEVQGEGYIGFAHAFLQAGARALLVSLWSVSDEASARIMERFYSNLQQPRRGPGSGSSDASPTLGEALREAKHWLRTYTDETGDHPWAHPYYWAGFILVGCSD